MMVTSGSSTALEDSDQLMMRADGRARDCAPRARSFTPMFVSGPKLKVDFIPSHHIKNSFDEIYLRKNANSTKLR